MLVLHTCACLILIEPNQDLLHIISVLANSNHHILKFYKYSISMAYMTKSEASMHGTRRVYASALRKKQYTEDSLS